MALNARERLDPIDVLTVDFEYCSIYRPEQGEDTDIGEPTYTFLLVATNVKCSIDPLVSSPTYIRQAGIREQLRQARVTTGAFIVTLLVAADVEIGDEIRDYDDTRYTVLYTENWHTHKEAFVSKTTTDGT